MKKTDLLTRYIPELHALILAIKEEITSLKKEKCDIKAELREGNEYV